MRTDGGRRRQRPRGAVIGPLGLLLAAALTGFGMWHALMHDGGDAPDAERLSRQVHQTNEHLVDGASR